MSISKHELLLLGAAALLGFALAAGPVLADGKHASASHAVASTK
jgi:hypothetical protein